jgi:GTP cyclohydrolase II
MFSYIDPSVKQELLRDGKLIYLDNQGNPCGANSGSANPGSANSGSVNSSNESNEPFSPWLSLVGPVPLPLRVCDPAPHFRWFAWVRHSDLHRIEQVVEQVRSEGPRMLFNLVSEQLAVNSVLLFGDFDQAEAPLVRIHSNCMTGDVFGSLRCDCGPQLRNAFERIREEGAGALVYMAGHEGRGIGLWAKAITYLLQDAGQDTYQANENLGLPIDSRDYHDAALILRYFRGNKGGIRLLGNNPLKRKALEDAGIVVIAQEPQVVGLTPYNVRYLASKREKGHIIPAESLSGFEATLVSSKPENK